MAFTALRDTGGGALESDPSRIGWQRQGPLADGSLGHRTQPTRPTVRRARRPPISQARHGCGCDARPGCVQRLAAAVAVRRNRPTKRAAQPQPCFTGPMAGSGVPCPVTRDPGHQPRVRSALTMLLAQSAECQGSGDSVPGHRWLCGYRAT